MNFNYRNCESLGPASDIFIETEKEEQEDEGSEVMTFSPYARKKYMMGERV